MVFFFSARKTGSAKHKVFYLKWLPQGTLASTRKAMTMTADSASYPAEPIRQNASQLTILELTQPDLPRLHICISKDRNNHYTQKTEYNVNSYNKDIVSFCYQTLISAGKMKSVPYY